MIPSLALTGFHRDGRHALGSSSPRSITATTTASSTTSGVGHGVNYKLGAPVAGLYR